MVDPDPGYRPRRAADPNRPSVRADEHDEAGRGLGRRGRTALLLAGVAAVVAVGLALIYAVSSVDGPSAQPTTSGTTVPSASGSSPADVLGEDAVLSAAQAGRLVTDSEWQVVSTESGAAGTASSGPACLATGVLDGSPTAQQETTRLLTSGGGQAPSALHRASLYATPEEAAQAYAVLAKALGTCASPTSFITAGATVAGLGDQSVALSVRAGTGEQALQHAMVLARTGRVVDVLDAARTGEPVALQRVARTLAPVVDAQCGPAGGGCTEVEVTATAAPPPLGGDVPGYLTVGDLPPVGPSAESWFAAPVDAPDETFSGSLCETVDWTQQDADDVTLRAYLVASSSVFGLTEITLDMRSAEAADKLVAKLRSDVADCGDRVLTASVTEPADVSGPGAADADVTGWTATVDQQTADDTQRYRVGVVSAGTKVAYTFVNEVDGYQLTTQDWDVVAVRAGQRMTQVP